MTSFGGENNRGIIFKTDGQGNNLVVQHSFSADSDHLGSNPARVHLVEASNGMLYGVTYTGGMNNYGTLFQYNPITGITSKKLDFKGESDGAYPFGSLVEANDGKLYGM
ncbi:MAG: choice-of-anchor tandem repeat GloVer-containing protein, partial [Flammeovirgaceae bacterium]